MSTNGHIILCYQLRIYGKCPYGDKCPFSHDLKAETSCPTLPGAVECSRSPSNQPERPHKAPNQRSDAPGHLAKNTESHNSTDKGNSHLSEQQHQRQKSQPQAPILQAKTQVRVPTAQKPQKKAKNTSGPPTYRYPQLHSAVQETVSAYIPFVQYREDSPPSSRGPDDRITNVTGFFSCRNGSCKANGWGTGVVAIKIKPYPNHGYDAVVFGQRCKRCNVMGWLEIDQQTYIDRVAYRLKKWAGFKIDQPPFKEKTTPPHESSLCEGCKRGLCPQNRAAKVTATQGSPLATDLDRPNAHWD